MMMQKYTFGIPKHDTGRIIRSSRFPNIINISYDAEILKNFKRRVLKYTHGSHRYTRGLETCQMRDAYLIYY